MSEINGADIVEVITKVKKAVREAQLTTQEGKWNVEIEKVDLTLKAFSEKEKGAGLKVKIPFVDIDAGFDGKLSEKETQTIQITLIPKEELILFGSRGEVEQELLDAIRVIKEGLKGAVEGEPQFELQNATAELNFVIGLGGEISLVARGSAGSETTHTVKLYLRPRDTCKN